MQDETVIAEFTQQAESFNASPPSRAVGEHAGLRLEHDELVPLVLDFEDWLERGSGGPGARPVIEHLLRERPPTAECFRVEERRGTRVLEFRVWLSR
jgi:hypothetical protein